jgi:hypothetical protein
MKQKKAYLTPEVRLHSLTHGVQLLVDSLTLNSMGEPGSFDDVGRMTLKGMGGIGEFEDED